MNYLFFNVYWLLRILKSALLPQANTQSPDVIAYLPMFLCTGLAVYNQVKKLTMGECASLLGQKKSAADRWVGVLEIVVWLSGKYMQDLRLRLLFISINLPYTHVWNTVIMSGVVPLIATWNCLLKNNNFPVKKSNE